jgi:2-(3-amino-3-carboxypropyl)histidine synthase
MDYEIDYKNIKDELKKSNAKRVLIQLPDGLKKDYAQIEKNLRGDYELFFWLGSCFGACDIPKYVETFGFDFIVHFGHMEFIKGE